jgi:hypothetical protein
VASYTCGYWGGFMNRLLASIAVLAVATVQLPSQIRKLDGRPDFQGIWTNATLTPVERPASFANKPALTDAEAHAFETKDQEVNTLDSSVESDFNKVTGGLGVGAYNNLFVDRGSELARVNGVKRTSLIIDPPDGKIPALTAQAEKERRMDFERYDTIRDRPLPERCLLGFSSTAGPPMLPVLYNNNYQIVQTADHIMILVEMVHDIRIIRMNGQHKPSTVRQWLGDSIGRWEGDTLVVDTTNFSDQNIFYEDVVEGLQFRSAKNLHVIERFRRIDAGTILYRATIDDPTTFSRQWTMEFPFTASRGPVFEYACHEGNYAMPDILGGARKLENEPAGK